MLDELLAELTSDDEYEESQMATRGRPAIRYRRRVVSSYFVPIDSNRTENGSDPNQLPGGPAKTAKPLSPDGARGLEPQGDDEGDERRRKKDTGRADSNHDSEEPQAGAADAESAASSAAGWLAQRDPAAPEVKPPCEHEVCFDALLGRCLAESDSAGLSDEQFEEVLAGAKAEGDLSRASVDRKATAVKADSSPEGTVSQNAKAPDIEPEAATCGCAAVLGPFGGHYPGCAAEAAS